MLNFEQAMQAAKAGKFLRLVDDGKGFMLPGILYAMPLEFVQVAATIALENTDLVLTAAQLVLLNVFRRDDNEAGLRFFTSEQFSVHSIWQEVDKSELIDAPMPMRPEPAMIPIVINPNSSVKN